MYCKQFLFCWEFVFFIQNIHFSVHAIVFLVHLIGGWCFTKENISFKNIQIIISCSCKIQQCRYLEQFIILADYFWHLKRISKLSWETYFWLFITIWILILEEYEWINYIKQETFRLVPSPNNFSYFKHKPVTLQNY